jgi:hypothetical protein
VAASLAEPLRLEQEIPKLLQALFAQDIQHHRLVFFLSLASFWVSHPDGGIPAVLDAYLSSLAEGTSFLANEKATLEKQHDFLLVNPSSSSSSFVVAPGLASASDDDCGFTSGLFGDDDDSNEAPEPATPAAPLPAPDLALPGLPAPSSATLPAELSAARLPVGAWLGYLFNLSYYDQERKPAAAASPDRTAALKTLGEKPFKSTSDPAAAVTFQQHILEHALSRASEDTAAARTYLETTSVSDIEKHYNEAAQEKQAAQSKIQQAFEIHAEQVKQARNPSSPPLRPHPRLPLLLHQQPRLAAPS